MFASERYDWTDIDGEYHQEVLELKSIGWGYRSFEDNCSGHSAPCGCYELTWRRGMAANPKLVWLDQDGNQMPPEYQCR